MFKMCFFSKITFLKAIKLYKKLYPYECWDIYTTRLYNGLYKIWVECLL